MARRKVVTDETVVAALMENSTLDAAAKQCGLSIRQLYDRRQDQQFAKRLREAQTAALGDTCRYLQHSTGSAAAVLLEIAENRDENAQVRVTAARAILEQAAKFTETVDVLERLERLEQDEGIRGGGVE